MSWLEYLMTGTRDTDGRLPLEGARTVEFATFWHGPLNGTTYSCLASFPARGASLRLYTYETNIDAPEGVEVVDARSICADISLLRRYFVEGRPSLATFSDRFRYVLMRKTGCCWVDADIICLEEGHFSREPIVWGRQPEAHGKALINNAVMKLPPRSSCTQRNARESGSCGRRRFFLGRHRPVPADGSRRTAWRLRLGARTRRVLSGRS